MTHAIVQSDGRYEWYGNILSYGFWVLLYSGGSPCAFRGPFRRRSEAETYAATMTMEDEQ